MAGLPTSVLESGGSEERGNNARLSSFVGAIAIGDLVKTTLGPKGMDKILQSSGQGGAPAGKITVTNDGATILKSVVLDNPAAQILVDISKVQDDEVGDGTTSVCVLASQLLREAEQLVEQRMHPTTIIKGFRIAAKAALDELMASSSDHGGEPEKFREDLLNIARTTLSSKVLSNEKELFSNMAVNAVLRLKGSTNLEYIQIIKKVGGSLKDSYLDSGFILDKKIGVGQPKRIENARIMIANTSMDADKIKIFGSRIRVDATSKVADIEKAEKDKMRHKVEKIIGHNINVFINRQLIYNFPEELFADAGIMAIEHADFDGIERLAAVTGGDITSTFDDPSRVKLGHCDLIEEMMLGEDRVLRFSGVARGEACTVVLRGASMQLLDEAERSLHDALCVLSQTTAHTRTVLGGGNSEIRMANAVDQVAQKTADKSALAVEAFARALRALPTIIADNGGYDSTDLVTKIRAAHTSGNQLACLDMYRGCVGNAAELGITESHHVKRSVVARAAEAAEMVLRVDNIIRTAVAKREERGGPGMGM